MREGFLIDDLVKIPEKYKKMTAEELDAEIKRLEKEEKERKTSVQSDI